MVQGSEAEACKIGNIEICNDFVGFIPWHPKEDLAAGKFKILEKCGQKRCDYISRDPECLSVPHVLFYKEGLDGEGGEEYDDSLAYFRVKAAVDDDSPDCGDEHDGAEGYGIFSEDVRDF